METVCLQEICNLPGGVSLAPCAGDNPALVLTQGERRLRVDLPHVKGLVAALVGGAADLAEVLAPENSAWCVEAVTLGLEVWYV